MHNVKGDEVLRPKRTVTNFVLLTGLRCQTMLCISLAMSCNARHLSGSMYGDASPIMLLMLLHKRVHAMRFGALSVSWIMRIESSLESLMNDY